jgi:hypothetical protein
MPLDLKHFADLRPYLYHLTGRENIAYIQEDMVLKSANTLFADAGQDQLRKIKRTDHTVLTIGKRRVPVRDQKPLYEGKIAFAMGCTFEDFVFHLNERVFFWPGWENEPVLSGRNHFKRYALERPIILRVGFGQLVAANQAVEPLFCKYNSGAPRCINGKGSPRGLQNTFLQAEAFHFPPGNVVEVTFKSRLRLPPSVQAAYYPACHWQPIKSFKL